MPNTNPQRPAKPEAFAHLEKKSVKIGDYRVLPVPTGLFALDGGAMFGTVPKVLWEKTNPADEQNRIPMEARALLLDGGPGGRRILVDCGIGADFVAKYGDKLGPKFAEMFAMDHDSGVEASLLALGIKLEDITDVILTHLHFDHAGGATRSLDGKLVPTFKNAKYYVQRANFENAKSPNLREKASYYLANFMPLQEAGVLILVDGDKENLLPGISVAVTNGHTVGQQTVRVSDGKTNLVYCADLIPTSTHVRLPWVMGYDLQPLVLIEEKKRTLAPAAEGNWYLFFEHDPYTDIATVESNRGDFTVKDRFHLSTDI